MCYSLEVFYFLWIAAIKFNKIVLLRHQDGPVLVLGSLWFSRMYEVGAVREVNVLVVEQFSQKNDEEEIICEEEK